MSSIKRIYFRCPLSKVGGATSIYLASPSGQCSTYLTEVTRTDTYVLLRPSDIELDWPDDGWLCVVAGVL